MAFTIKDKLTDATESSTPEYHGDSVIQKIGSGKKYVKEGKGKLTWANGCSYEGEFRNNEFDGHGRFTWSDDLYYEGSFSDGMINGHGEYHRPGGFYFRGEFRDGEFSFGEYHGKNLYYTSDPSADYNGPAEWEPSERNLCLFPMKRYSGEIFWENGNHYKGDIERGLRSGRGEMQYAGGGRYIGEFKNDKWDGKGELQYDNGDRYVGEFKNGRRHGRGEIHLKDGGHYIGEYANNKMDGRGEYRYPDGTVYSGELKDGDFNGNGEMRFTDGRRYIGKFKDDKFSGDGVMHYPDGTEWEGTWSDGELIIGVKRTPDGRSEAYEKGKGAGPNTSMKCAPSNNDAACSQEKQSAIDDDEPDYEEIEVECGGGMVYRGTILNGKFHGYGRVTLPVGWFFEGTFENGKRVEGTELIKTFLLPCYYRGQYKDNRREGQGVFFKKSISGTGEGIIYKGGFKADLPSGYGEYDGNCLYTSGSSNGTYRYYGEWKDGKRHGFGRIEPERYTLSDYERRELDFPILECMWIDGKIAPSGTYKVDGVEYKGEIVTRDTKKQRGKYLVLKKGPFKKIEYRLGNMYLTEGDYNFCIICKFHSEING